MELPSFLTRHAYGEVRLTGHRIGLLHVVDALREGLSAEDIGKRFPTLPLVLIQQVIAYYLGNQAEVDTYVANCHAELDRQEQAPRPGPTLDEMRQRLEAK